MHNDNLPGQAEADPGDHQEGQAAIVVVPQAAVQPDPAQGAEHEGDRRQLGNEGERGLLHLDDGLHESDDQTDHQ